MNMEPARPNPARPPRPGIQNISGRGQRPAPAVAIECDCRESVARDEIIMTAGALGLIIPQTLLVTADEVIE